MIIPVPVLIMITLIGMIILGLIRPPLAVVLPLLGIYIILMLIPYILPDLTINQYLNVKYVILPVMGLAVGYGISILMSRYMNVDARSLLGLKQSQRKVKKSRIMSRQKVKGRREIRPEDLAGVINESINAMRLGISTNEALGNWVEYYDGWADAIIGISRRFINVRESVEIINKEAALLSRISQYESRALSLGFGLREESEFKRRSRSRGRANEELIAYVRPEELTNEFMGAAQLMSNYVNEFSSVLEELIHNKDISQYMVNSRILVLYVDGVPRKFIMINKGDHPPLHSEI